MLSPENLVFNGSISNFGSSSFERKTLQLLQDCQGQLKSNFDKMMKRIDDLETQVIELKMAIKNSNAPAIAPVAPPPPIAKTPAVAPTLPIAKTPVVSSPGPDIISSPAPPPPIPSPGPPPTLNGVPPPPPPPPPAAPVAPPPPSFGNQIKSVTLRKTSKEGTENSGPPVAPAQPKMDFASELQAKIKKRQEN